MKRASTDCETWKPRRAWPPAAPLGWAAAAAALFFAVLPAPAPPSGVEGLAAASIDEALVQALAQAMLPVEEPPPSLPLLDDNSADVEALDATHSTVVFSTDSSRITVIWLADGEGLADDPDLPQGT